MVRGAGAGIGNRLSTLVEGIGSISGSISTDQLLELLAVWP